MPLLSSPSSTMDGTEMAEREPEAPEIDPTALTLDQSASQLAPGARASADWIGLLAINGGSIIRRSRSAAASTNTAAAFHECEMVDARGAAMICGVSRTLWFDMRNAGRVPAPIRLGRRVLWRVDELQRWIDAACPPLHQWKRINEQRNRGTAR